MFDLPHDVFGDAVLFGIGKGEGSVSVLPMREIRENVFCLDPLGSANFKSLTKSARPTVGWRLVRIWR